ncbi:MAG: hydroxyacid dehydrogenase [Candidatus Staskawiczbacteria bacterium RIFCSPLOWO2_12_FULL_37_15]|uniref:Hydroxyacid dehydrogenase n=1 Tax=Candidatus Staskawiczbacteria bacterium RIFCSPLOWO2_12_FULL_37_15 TaxID=1802218 RepID=A0A1G2IKY6_9BACT|nr:MAG: D-isomer specific 2-hydroxyacid dehydrogenase NAD-binding protein [Parcubacteria group bacterium GW2011_GWA2_37_10]OGZ75303.1 MAG: hydroxyacid dehydrogenase [Candidatus Staskawiczbacteria bacterium RIFCSPLOWO2_12_FULL_37_15]
MKAAFFEIEDWEKEYISSKINNQELSFFPGPVAPENIAEIKNCQIISPFIYSKIDENILSELSELKFISTRSTGFDHIDMSETRRINILVSNVPSYGENTVAEHTFALILDLSRKIYQSINRAKSGDFSLDGLRGFDLKNKTLGIIGLGHIGQRVAKIARGFEMNVLVSDLNKDKKLVQELGFQYTDINDLLAKSDIISLHVPYNKDTDHLINLHNINLIKKGAYLINTARGGLVETTALIESLGKGILAGAGLDVLEEECFVKEERQLLSKEFPKTCDLKTVLQNHILLQQENVIITPHNAFNSKEALERILETTVQNIQAFLIGKAINIVK